MLAASLAVPIGAQSSFGLAPVESSGGGRVGSASPLLPGAAAASGDGQYRSNSLRPLGSGDLESHRQSTVVKKAACLDCRKCCLLLLGLFILLILLIVLIVILVTGAYAR